MIMTHVRLSVGAPTGCRIIALPAGIALASITALLVWIVIDQALRFFAGGGFGVGAVLIFIVFVIIMTVVLYAVGALTWVYLRIARNKIWLKDTVLVERRFVLRRRIDLGTARVELRSAAHADVAELSLVVTERSGKGLDLPVQKGQATLPAPELAALAQAILGNHRLARPVDDNHTEAMIVADRLRKLAAIET